MVVVAQLSYPVDSVLLLLAAVTLSLVRDALHLVRICA
jgi:hypothetical protein